MHFAPVARFEMGTMVLVRREGEEGGNFTLVFGTACKKSPFPLHSANNHAGLGGHNPFFSLGLLSRLTSPSPSTVLRLSPAGESPLLAQDIALFLSFFPCTAFFFFHRVLESWNDPATRRGRPLFVRHIAGDLNSIHFGQLASSPRDCKSGRTKLGRGQCITSYSQEEVIREIFATHKRRLRS